MTEDAGEPKRHRLRLARIRHDEIGNAVQRIEEEVRVDLGAECAQLRLGHRLQQHRLAALLFDHPLFKPQSIQPLSKLRRVGRRRKSPQRRWRQLRKWLEGVKPEESIAFLADLVNQTSQSHRVLEEALLSISFHAAPDAAHALEQIASSSASEHTREQAAFWLGIYRGHDGFVALKSLENKSTDDARFREKLTFDFSQNSDPAAEDELLHMAKFDSESKVRGQALFWIAQKAGKRATEALTDAIQNDPETDVKKKAVFALSQLPKDESIPQLIHVADTNANLTVRKEAFFWLGQSQDPRALAYLEQVLKR